MNSVQFAKILLDWHTINKRILPWKEDNDPYKIWLSEIILQQTRVSQGTPYFLRFLKEYPDINALADASSDQVMKSWQGLGYYTRARNLHATAQDVVQRNNSVFPDTYEEVLALKGIGPYSAAAIVSFAYELPYPVVDGNVIRLVSRILGIMEAIESKSVKKHILYFVKQSILDVRPSDFNQAIMDFGATLCTPSSPDCTVCPFNQYCKAYQSDMVSSIPFRTKKKERVTRFFHYYDISDPNGMTLLHCRSQNDIWQNLYQFPMLETSSKDSPGQNDIKKELADISDISPESFGHPNKTAEIRQTLTHRKIVGTFYKLVSNTPFMEINKSYCLVDRQKVSNFAFPKIMTTYLADYG
ncbi:MAG: A/G-specific adenine glycosylase [Saprospiraceae bacterium]